jgi:xylulose-5-phosphate/fructose-6-phosphate phosphoketolase
MTPTDQRTEIRGQRSEGRGKTGDGSRTDLGPSPLAAGPLSGEELRKMDAYWRASNYLAVGQIYLLDNPLLREPLKRTHIKPRLLGHWGTCPGLNMLYVHLNRVIKRDDLNMIYIIGPGHGGPSLVAHAYLEGTYSEVYPNISQDAEGIKKLFKQFSFPGGIPSHVERSYHAPGSDPGARHQLIGSWKKYHVQAGFRNVIHFFDIQ